MKAEQLEIDRLRREVKKLKAERDILKKAAAYFARGVERSSASFRSAVPSGRRHGFAEHSAYRGLASMPG
jgi:hypothetical protein